jgi:hypothetical protein
MSWETHWRGAGMMLDTQNQRYSLLGDFRAKKRTGAGSQGQNIWISNGITLDELESSLERCWDGARHTETGIFAFWGNFEAKNELGQAISTKIYG